MVKLKMIRLYKTEDVPDHLLQEVSDLVCKIALELNGVCNDIDPNIVLSAFNRFHAHLICEIVADSSLVEGAQTEAIGLIKNVEHISGKKVIEGDE